MNNSLPLFIGLRYVRSKQREGFFSIVSGFSFGAMMLGVMALIVVLSVMNGFDKEIKTRILQVIPHITLKSRADRALWDETQKRVSTLEGVTAASLYIEGQGMLSAGGELKGVNLQGVNPANTDTFGFLHSSMLAGDFTFLRPGEYGVVIGSLLARSLNVMTGDSVLLTLPDLIVTPVGIFPRVKQVKVVGVFQVGAQVDSGLAFLHIEDMQLLLRAPGQVDGLRVSVFNPFQLEGVSKRIVESVGSEISLSSWQQSLSTLFQAIKMEKTVVGLLLTVIIGVAAFNIVASLVLMVADKRKDIAVLRAMGATGAVVTRIFRVQGMVVGTAGVLLGVILGSLLAWQLGPLVAALEAITGAHIFDPDVYFISEIPSQLQWLDVALIAASGLLLSFLATLYPAYRAGQVSPAEIMRYDH